MAQQIYSDDIKLYESEKMNDAADGGGRITNREIQSGQVNNVFQDISRVDHANGSVEVRKAAAGIKTENTAPLLGAHLIVAEPPEDESVGVVIFQTPRDGRETDTRSVARDYLETYFVRASREFMQPLGLNLEGSNVLSLFAPRQVSINTRAGDTIVLHDAATDREEYVKISSLTRASQTFVYRDSRGDYTSFTGQLIRAQLTVPLQRTWDGGEARPSGVENSSLNVYSTAISNAARYRGVSKLAEPFDAHDTVLRVENVFHSLVPVARQERALVNQSPYTDARPIVRATDQDESPLKITARSDDDISVMYMPTAITRRSLTVETVDSSWSERGTGEMHQDSGNLSASISVDYADGVITTTGLKDRDLVFSYLPAASVPLPATTTSIEITQANLGLVYTFDLSDLPPEPGTITIEYMTEGDWLRLIDDGDGLLEGNGVGDVDYVSAQIQATLEHEPEVGSHIILSYLPASTQTFERISGALAVTPKYTRRLNFGEPIEPGSVVISAGEGAEKVTSTDDGNGRFSGDAGAGSVDYSIGELLFEPAPGSDKTTYTVTADAWVPGVIKPGQTAGVKTSSTPSVDVIGESLHIATLEEVVPGTMRIMIVVRHSVTNRYVDSVLGTTKSGYTDRGLFYFDAGDGRIYEQQTGADVGSISYTSGLVVIDDFFWGEDVISTEESAGGRVEAQHRTEKVVFSSATYRCLVDHVSPEQAGGSFEERTKTITVSGSSFVMGDVKNTRPVVPRSLWFRAGGVDYFDDGDGKVIRNYSAVTGAGVEVGNIDYTNASMDIEDIVLSSVDEVEIRSLVRIGSPRTASWLVFAIKDRPLRHASYQMNWQPVDGPAQRFEADESGVVRRVPGGEQVGSINIQTGVVIVDASLLPGANNDERQSVLGSLRYNAVKSESLPADPEIIGLNVQRLPIDGRVPIFKLGDTIVLNHWGVDSIDEPEPAQQINLTRDHVAEVQVLCDDVELDRAQYEVDLEAGTITFLGGLSLQDKDGNPLAGDWSVRHRIEHMALATRVQLNGSITLQTASAHAFPAGASVSSALLFGDLQADVLNVFEQRTWQENNPNWSSSPDSSGPTSARYDTVNSPIELTNESAVTDSWALWFRTPSTVDVVSRELGVVATNQSISNDIAPINPNTDKPYFVVRRQGWGSGWATNNVVRFDTVSALAPFWMARTVMPSQGITQSDSFVLSPRGDSQ